MGKGWRMKGDRGFGEIGYLVGGGLFLLFWFVFSAVDDHRRRQNLRPDPMLFDYVVHQHNDPKVERRHARLLKLHLRNGSDPNTLNDNENTPLHVALSHHEPTFRIIRVLLKFRADPNFPDPNGNTPLHLAARLRNGYGGVMTALLRAGGDPFIVIKGQAETPYALAVRLGNTSAVRAIEKSKRFKEFKKERRGP